MKWTPEQIEELKTLCMAGVSNAELAQRFAMDVTEIHAIRSRIGYTIPKVNAMLAEKGDAPTCGAEISSLNEAIPAPLAPEPIIGEALETFSNDGELCIVIARTGETALIVMPRKHMAAFVVPAQHISGKTSWWHGHYFDRLEDAYEYYKSKTQEES